MKKLILLRHGQSQWNLENRFTGWTDVPLSEKGMLEAAEAGKKLQAAGITVDKAYTSRLKRAIKTLWICLEEMDRMWIPVERDWRLNERHYGALQGLNKAETAQKYGDEQVHIWRRSYATTPPLIEKNDERYPGLDPRYSDLTEQETPVGESLKNTIKRFLPLWEEKIKREILETDKTILIAAHGNSLRALVMILDKLSEEQVLDLNIPTGVPLVYELDEKITPLKHYYL